MFKYDKRANEAVARLDNHDLSEWIKLCLFFGCRDPYSICAMTRTWFADTEIDEAFDVLSIDELMIYLSNRYNVVFDEEPTRYRMREK